MTVEDRNDHADLGHNVNRRVNRRLDRRLDEDLDRSTPAASPLQGQDALGQPAAGLRAWMAAAGEPEYRGAQLYHALYAQRLFDFASITSLPAALRTRLATELRIGIPQIARRYLSTDGSVRYLLSPPWPDISQEASREPGGVTDGSRAAIDAPLDQLISSAALSNGVASGVAS